jgi:type I restriction enzyme S subunit
VSWKKVKIGSLLTESKIESSNPNPEKRIRVRLNVKGVEKRPDKSEVEGATKQYIRKANQFIYGKQNFHKGAFGIIPKELDEFESSSDIPSFDVSLNCLPEWIFYFFKDKDRYLQLEKYATGVGSKRISPKKIFDIEIPLPPIAKQKIITNKIKASEEKDAQLQLQIDNQKTNLKNLRKQILQDAIEGKLTKEWREQNPNIEPASELLKKIKQEKEKLIAEKKIKKEKPLPKIEENEVPFELPKGWVWAFISEIGLCFTGDSINESVKNLKYKVSKNGLNYIGTKDVGFECSGVNYNTGVVIPFDEAGTKFKIANKGSIFICIEGGSSGKKMALIDQDVCFGNKLLATQIFKSVSYEYVYLVYQTFLFESEFRNKSKGLRGGVSVNLFKTIKIPLPPLLEQLAIVSKLQTLMQKLDEAEKQIEKSLETSKLLTKAILAEAFSFS